MGFIPKQGAGGFISGNAFVKSASRGRLAFMKSGGPALGVPYVDDAAKNIIVVPASGTVTATTPACGWTVSLNGGAYAAPASVNIGTNPDQLNIVLASDVLCSDALKISYDPTSCDLAVGDVPVDEITAAPVQNRVNTPAPVIMVQPIDVEVDEPAAAVFTITASSPPGGGPIHYQWVLAGASVGGDSDTLTIDPTEMGTHYVSCTVYNDCQSVVSELVLLTVIPDYTAAVPVGEPNTIILTFNGTLGAFDPLCGWSYSINAGADTPPSSAVIAGNVLTLTIPDGVVFGDVVTVSYDPTSCNLTIDGVAVPAIVDGAVVNNSTNAPFFSGTIPDMSGQVDLAMTPYDASVHYEAGGVPTGYSLLNAPTWMSISAVGLITGTPDAIATTTGIIVRATNANGSADSNEWDFYTSAAAGIRVVSSGSTRVIPLGDTRVTK